MSSLCLRILHTHRTAQQAIRNSISRMHCPHASCPIIVVLLLVLFESARDGSLRGSPAHAIPLFPLRIVAGPFRVSTQLVAVDRIRANQVTIFLVGVGMIRERETMARLTNSNSIILGHMSLTSEQRRERADPTDSACADMVGAASLPGGRRVQMVSQPDEGQCPDEEPSDTG